MASKDKPLSALDRLVLQAMGEDRVMGLEDDPAKTQFPQLWLLLSTIYYGRDKIKQPAVLTIRLGPQGVLATLADRDMAHALDVGCGHLKDVLQTLEDALSQEHPPWRSYGRKEPSSKKRKSNS